MTFYETPRFPTEISRGSSGGPGFSTSIIKTDAGIEERIPRFNTAARKYNARWGVKDWDDLYEVYNFYIAMQGPAHGFRWKDFLDYTTATNGRDAPATDDVQIGVGDGTETEFQLVKKYEAGAISRTRNLVKPVSGTTVLQVDGTPLVSGWSVNTATGIVTLDAPPNVSIIVEAGCEFDVPVRFGEEIDELLSINLEHFNAGDISDIPLEEIRDGLTTVDDLPFRGAVDHTGNSNLSIALSEGVIHTFDPANVIDLTLPDESTIQPGGPIFVLVNLSAYLISVKYSDATAAFNLAAGAKLAVYLSTDGGSTQTWYAL
jgi:uncharacterized protein (TIGR02217 family)